MKTKPKVVLYRKRCVEIITNYTRQSELIDILKFEERINIIGAGALGSWLAFFLLKMGFKDIHIYDFDVVEEHNIPNQMFMESQINVLKANAIEGVYNQFFDTNTDNNRLVVHIAKIDKNNAFTLKGIVFSCVDSMSARKEIYETCYKHGNAKLWIEGRIGLFGAYIYSLNNKDKNALTKYEETLYSDDVAEKSACGISQTALPSAVNCASLMLMQMISWYRGNDIYNKIEYSIPDLFDMKERW